MPPTQGSYLRTVAWWDAIQQEAMTCQSMQELIPQVHVHLLWESIEEESEFSQAAILEMKVGKESERVITDSRGRAADALFMNLESVALAIEGSDISIPEENFVPIAI